MRSVGFLWLFALRMSSPVRQVIDGAIKANKVMVFSKSYCPYCTRAKQAITQAGEKFGVIELDVQPTLPAAHCILNLMVGCLIRSMPTDQRSRMSCWR